MLLSAAMRSNAEMATRQVTLWLGLAWLVLATPNDFWSTLFLLYLRTATKGPDVDPAINRNGELCDTDMCEGHGSSPCRVRPIVTCLIPAPQVISPVDVTSKASVNKRFSIHFILFYIFVTTYEHHIQLRRNERQCTGPLFFIRLFIA